MIIGIPKEIKEQVGPEESVICGLSGGVDSSVVATLLHKAIGNPWERASLIPPTACAGVLDEFSKAGGEFADFKIRGPGSISIARTGG